MPRSVDVDGPHPVDRHVGRRLCELRVQRGYNQSDLGRALGLTFQQIQKYEKGANRISASKLWQAAGFLGVDISYFFGGLAVGPQEADQVSEPAATALGLQLSRLCAALPIEKQKLAVELVRQFAG